MDACINFCGGTNGLQFRNIQVKKVKVNYPESFPDLCISIFMGRLCLVMFGHEQSPIINSQHPVIAMMIQG